MNGHKVTITLYVTSEPLIVAKEAAASAAAERIGEEPYFVSVESANCQHTGELRPWPAS